MRNLLFFLIPLFLISCDKDDPTSYPKSYTFHSSVQDEEGLFLLTAPTTAVPIPVTSGTYGQFGEGLKTEILESMRTIYDIHEIELLSQSSLRMHVTVDGEIIDTVVAYTIHDEKLIIDALPGSDLLRYNDDTDQIEMCSRTEFALAGPNVVDPGVEYEITWISECLADYDLEDYVNLFINAIDFQAQDTVGIFITTLIYK